MRPCDSVSGTRCTRCTPDSHLKTEYAPSPRTSNVDLAKAALVAAGRAERLGLVAEPLGVAREHAVDVAREERGLVAAGARPQLDDDVAAVVRVALDERQAQLLLDRRRAPPRWRRARPRGTSASRRRSRSRAVSRASAMPWLAARQRCPSAACSLSSLCRRPSCAMRCRSDDDGRHRRARARRPRAPARSA